MISISKDYGRGIFRKGFEMKNNRVLIVSASPHVDGRWLKNKVGMWSLKEGFKR